jgi:hypothetical protein
MVTIFPLASEMQQFLLLKGAMAMSPPAALYCFTHLTWSIFTFCFS